MYISTVSAPELAIRQAARPVPKKTMLFFTQNIRELLGAHSTFEW